MILVKGFFFVLSKNEDLNLRKLFNLKGIIIFIIIFVMWLNVYIIVIIIVIFNIKIIFVVVFLILKRNVFKKVKIVVNEINVNVVFGSFLIIFFL